MLHEFDDFYKLYFDSVWDFWNKTEIAIQKPHHFEGQARRGVITLCNDFLQFAALPLMVTKQLVWPHTIAPQCGFFLPHQLLFRVYSKGKTSTPRNYR